MNELSAKAQDNLALIKRECQKIEARISAYERRAFDETCESLNPIGAQAAVEGLLDEMSAPVAAGLKACDEHLDSLDERLNDVEGSLGEELRMLNQKRTETARRYNEKRRVVNRGNLSKGFWPMYGGLFFCIIFAMIANGFGWGMVGSVVCGIVGYAAGSYILQFFMNSMTKNRIDPEVLEAGKAELDAIKAEFDETHEQIKALQDHLSDLGKLDDPISELQDLLQDAIDEWDDRD